MNSQNAAPTDSADSIPHILSRIPGPVFTHGDALAANAFCRALSISLEDLQFGKDTKTILRDIYASESMKSNCNQINNSSTVGPLTADDNNSHLDTSKMDNVNLASAEETPKPAKKKNRQKKKKIAGADSRMIVKVPETTYIMLGVQPDLVPKCHVISGQFRIPIYQEEDFERVETLITDYMKQAVAPKKAIANTSSPCPETCSQKNDGN